VSRRRRRTKAIQGGEKPQVYEHRAECALEALGHGLSGAHLVLTYLREQLGPDWKSQQPLDDAEIDFKRALFWLAKRKK
jgi:hypothetical protein